MQGNIAVGGFSSWSNISIACAPRLPEETNGNAFIGTCLPGEESSIASCKASSLANRRLEKSPRGNATICLSLRPKPVSRGNVEPLAPLQPESRQGRFLTELLRMRPRHVPVAAEEQLQKLTEERATASSLKECSLGGLESVLYKRMALMKTEEISKTVEDIMYALVVQKFVVARVPLVVKTPTLETGSVDIIWPDKEKKLLSVHSREVMGIVQEYLTMILGGSRDVDPHAHVQISRTLVGRTYGASIEYGYVLKRVDPRYQLEKRLNYLPHYVDTEQAGSGMMNSLGGSWQGLKSQLSLSGFFQRRKSRKFMAYMRSFDSDTVIRFESTRSRESSTIMEKQREALFGRPSLQVDLYGSVTICHDEMIWVSFSKLKRLILEAVAFGSFLYEVEMHMDSHYELGGD